MIAAKEGAGNLSVGELVTDSLQVSQIGMGDTCINGGSAESGRVQTEGTGNIILRGRFNSVTRRSSGVGQVRVQGSV